MKMLLILCLIPMAIFATQNGGDCTDTPNSCDSGLICKERPLSMITHNPRWGGISYANVAAMLYRARSHYDKNLTEDYLWDYSQLLTEKPVIKSAKVSFKKDIPPEVTFFPFIQKEQKGSTWNNSQDISPLASSFIDWRNKSDTKTITKESVYRGWAKVSTDKGKYIEYKMKKEKGNVGISIHHILAYYYNKKTEEGLTYYEYLNSVAKNNRCTNKAQLEGIVCKNADEIVHEILDHIGNYRQFLKKVNPKTQTQNNLRFFKLSHGGQVVNLEAHDEPVLGPEYCYSAMTDTNGLCLPTRKACTCAREGEPAINNQCCPQKLQPQDDDGFIFPALPLTVQNGICTKSYLPSSPYGPGDGSSEVDYKIMLREEKPSNPESGVGGCDFYIQFNDISRLSDLQLPVQTDEEKSDSLQAYINHGQLIILALEYLFADPAYPDCLIPNFKGHEWFNDYGGETFSTIMQKYIATPLKEARQEANAKMATAAADMETYASNLGSEDCDENNDCDTFSIGFVAAEMKEKNLLATEKALLYGPNGQGGINSILNCQNCPQDPKEITTNGTNNIMQNPTWLSVLAEGYKNIKYKTSYSKDILKFEKGKQNNHKFQCPRASLKKAGKDAWERKIKLKVAKLFEDGYIDEQFLLDPPIPSVLGFENIGTKISKNERKMRPGEFIELISSKVADYFPEFSLTSEIPSFLPVKNKKEFIQILKKYINELAHAYSKKVESGGRTSTWKHPVPSRIDSFYPTVETALEEVGYYLDQLVNARTRRITCIRKYNPKLNTVGSLGKSQLGKQQKIEGHFINTDSNELKKQNIDLANDLTTKLEVEKLNSNMQLSNDKMVTNAALSLSSDGNQITSQGSFQSESYNYNAAKRAQERFQKRNQTLSKVKDKAQHQNLKKASQLQLTPSLVTSLQSFANMPPASSTHSTMPQSHSRHSSNLNKQAKKSNSKVTLYTNPQGTNSKTKTSQKKDEDKNEDDFLEGLDFEIDTAEAEAEKQATENLDMINFITKNQSSYSSKENDSLFDQISKAYFRSGYRRVLSIRKK